MDSKAFTNRQAVKAFQVNLGTYLSGAAVIPCAIGTLETKGDFLIKE